MMTKVEGSHRSQKAPGGMFFHIPAKSAPDLRPVFCVQEFSISWRQRVSHFLGTDPFVELFRGEETQF